MSEILASPISWKSSPTPEVLDLLDDLQGNILKGHGRQHLRLLFLRFRGEDEACALIRVVRPYVTTAYEQLQSADLARRTGRHGLPFVSLLLTARGYERLRVTPPDSEAFRAGLQRSLPVGEEHLQAFDSAYSGRDRIDAVLLLATGEDVGDTRQINMLEASYRALIAPHAELVASERGRVRRLGGQSVEPFGYADGISQPLMLEEDVAQVTARRHWDPACPPSNALIRCPTGNGYGSYMVFLKLEQNLKSFGVALSHATSLSGTTDDEAGADLVGRARDGSPRALGRAARGVRPPSNDFNYNGRFGAECPVTSHIRVANPRNAAPFHAHGQPDPGRQRLFPRRGMPYSQPDVPGGGAYSGSLPATKSGLLFMAYNADIRSQFESTLKSLINNDDMFSGLSSDGAVRMRGGDYFFAPSPSGLLAMCQR